MKNSVIVILLLSLALASLDSSAQEKLVVTLTSDIVDCPGRDGDKCQGGWGISSEESPPIYPSPKRVKREVTLLTSEYAASSMKEIHNTIKTELAKLAAAEIETKLLARIAALEARIVELEKTSGKPLPKKVEPTKTQLNR